MCAVCRSLLASPLFIAKERAQVSTLHRTIRIEQQQLAALDRQQNQFQSVIGRPANADVFSKSVFYNELIARRAVSWTRVFEDLGHVMPRTVQLVSLRLPQVVASSDRDKNHIELNMLVGTQQPAAILQLLKNFSTPPCLAPLSLRVSSRLHRTIRSSAIHSRCLMSKSFDWLNINGVSGPAFWLKIASRCACAAECRGAFFLYSAPRRFAA